MFTGDTNGFANAFSARFEARQRAFADRFNRNSGQLLVAHRQRYLVLPLLIPWRAHAGIDLVLGLAGGEQKGGEKPRSLKASSASLLPLKCGTYYYNSHSDGL